MQIYRICRTVGLSIAASLEPLAHCRNVASLSLFYRYYFGRCSKDVYVSFFPRTYRHWEKKNIYTTSEFNFVKDIKRCRANLSSSNLLHALKFSQIKNNPFNFLLKFNNSHFLRSKTMILLLKFGNLVFLHIKVLCFFNS